MDIGLDFT